jgi:hypothetical protein
VVDFFPMLRDYIESVIEGTQYQDNCGGGRVRRGESPSPVWRQRTEV